MDPHKTPKKEEEDWSTPSSSQLPSATHGSLGFTLRQPLPQENPPKVESQDHKGSIGLTIRQPLPQENSPKVEFQEHKGSTGLTIRQSLPQENPPKVEPQEHKKEIASSSLGSNNPPIAATKPSDSESLGASASASASAVAGNVQSATENSQSNDTTNDVNRRRQSACCSCGLSRCRTRCSCYKANRGCSLSCRCQGCENLCGTREDAELRLSLEQPSPSKCLRVIEPRPESLVIQRSTVWFPGCGCYAIHCHTAMCHCFRLRARCISNCRCVGRENPFGKKS